MKEYPEIKHAKKYSGNVYSCSATFLKDVLSAMEREGLRICSIATAGDRHMNDLVVVEWARPTEFPEIEGFGRCHNIYIWDEQVDLATGIDRICAHGLKALGIGKFNDTTAVIADFI